MPLRSNRKVAGLALLVLAGALPMYGEGMPDAEAPRPPYPNLDNLLPNQADQTLQAYHQALKQWQDARLAALSAAEGGPAIVVPPRPHPPKLIGLTSEQQQAALASFREETDRWRPLYLRAAAAEDELKRRAGVLLDKTEMNRLEAAAITLPSDYSWRQDAAGSGLGPATVAQLERDSLAIAGPYFRQSFEVYAKSPQAPFVTSDSLLNGFHVLLEDSIRQVELTRSSLLRQTLEDAWSSLDARLAKELVSRAEIEPFSRHLALVIGPALRLLGSKAPLGDAEVEAAVGGEVKKIEAAEAVALPPWLTPADASLVAIDYRRCRPIGFYAVDPVLARYYEATRWLQMIPLRASRETEVGAAALWADLARDDNPAAGGYSEPAISQFVDDGTAIFGDPEAPAVSQAFGGDSILRGIGQHRQPVSEIIGRFRKDMMLARASRPWFVPGDASLRVLPEIALPDTVWFAQVDHWRGRPQLPNGPEIAAWLGSPLATTEAVSREGPAFGPFVARAAADRREREARRPNVPNLYYNALAALFGKPDPAAPAFLSGEAWQRKSEQTALAGWAQLRHTWELQAKFDELTLGISLRPAGFVEPNAEFFRRLGETVDLVVNQLMEQGIFTDSSPEEASSSAAGAAIYATGPSPGLDLWHRWQELDLLTHHLEVLVQKQLRGVDWDRADAAVLKSYGVLLGDIMGYEGNASDRPRDDAPRWTTVAHDPTIDENLAVAIGRPRALYVLYPWKGTPILCRGAVMSYYEQPEARRLTDPEWKTELDGSNPPPQPSWIQPLLPAAQ